MASAAKQAPRSWERRILHREILKYGGSMLRDPEIYQDDDPNGSMLLGCNYSTPQLAADATLTGFAQLAALRMNCKHGFISLIDDKYQHVLAESTRTISPYDVNEHVPEDELLVGVRTLDIDFGICPLTLAAFSKGTEGGIDTDITFADETKYVISDLLNEPRVSKARFMENNTTSRFYAEVPLRSSEGLVIGSVSVIDNEPRTNPSMIEVRSLQDIALMTMDHFDLIHIREISLRAERLMQGLGHFNSGKSSISQWIMDHPDRALARDGEDYYIHTPGAMGLSPSLDEIATPGMDDLVGRGSSNLSPNAQMRGYFDRRISNSNLGTPSEIPTGVDGLLATHQRQEIQEPILSPMPVTDIPRSVDTPKTSVPRPVEFVQSRVSADIHDAFSRASNLIRQSMDLDATCFLEISPDARFRIRERKNSEDDGSSQVSTISSTKRSRRPRLKSIATEATATATLPGAAITRAVSDTNKARLCNRLGLATRLKSNTADPNAASDFATFPELSLSKLAAEFPGGHIFKFDNFGALSVADESKRPIRHDSARQKLASLMVKHFPDARSLIFMPLYDNEKQHLYAGFFGWTTNPKRVLRDSESVYVLGFANSIMCEVMRLETLAVEKAKSDFMSSMSHELRSPLHGILGATQLLQESEMPPAQRELATMIDSCGRTLLDIMNNLLEHAKINNISNGTRNRKGSKLAAEEVDNESTVIDNQLESVDLATLVEETVTSVAAGHAVREHRSEQTSARRRASSRIIVNGASDEDDIGPDGLPLPPAVIIDIPCRPNWVFQTEAGSWRRIVMNLVGNALKYTQRGRIDVSIEILEDDEGDQESSNLKVVLTVQDTGQGISDSYLKHRLYTPFAQENNLSVGAGLGLSIVNRLVSALNGSIHMESEVDVGTKVTVTVPISRSGPGHASLVRSNSVTTIENIRLGLPTDELICFLGFDAATAAVNSNGDANMTTQLSARSQASTMHRLRETLSKLCTSWLDLPITEDAEKATLIVVEEKFAKKLLRQNPSHPVHHKRVIAVNAHDRATQNEQRWLGRCAFLSVPIGPVKFARVLSALLQQDSRRSESPATFSDKRRISRVLSPTDRGSPHQVDRSQSPNEPPTKRQRLTSTTALVNGISAANGTSTATEATNPNADYRVLLVEDNMINLKLLASFIRKLGFPYTTATNGQEALDEYMGAHEDGEPFRYVFMDITMPVMDGLTSTRRIRAYEKSKRVEQPAEIVALTGLGHVEAQNEALASGVDRYFCKPVRLDALKKLLVDKEG